MKSCCNYTIAVCGPLGHGTGADMATYEIVLALTGAGCRVSALVERGDVHLPEGCQADEISAANAMFPVGGTFKAMAVSGLEYIRMGMRRIRQHRRMKSWDYDFMLVNDAQGHRMLAFRDLEHLPRKYFVLQYMPDYLGAHGLKGETALDRNLKELALYDGYIAITQAVADAWRETGLVGKKPLWFISNCGRDDVFREVCRKDKFAIRASLDLPTHKKVIICPGSLQFRKGQDLLLQAFALLPPELQQSLCIYFIGTGGGYYTSYLSDLASVFSADQVRFMGFRQNICEFVAAADAVVIPSRSEAQGITVLEGMALNTVVIASNAGGIPEMIEDGVHGYLFEKDDCRALAKALTQFTLADHDGNERLKNNAYARYWSEFSRVQCRERWAQCVSDISERHKVGE